jgi:ABC-type multidrug transport system fused ATPase/permease subunit
VRDGRVVESGRWAELLQREGAFHELHHAQHGEAATRLADPA